MIKVKTAYIEPTFSSFKHLCLKKMSSQSPKPAKNVSLMLLIHTTKSMYRKPNYLENRNAALAG